MNKRIFKKDDTYENIKNILSKELVTYYNINTKEFVQNGLAALVLLKDKERVTSFSKRVDEIYSKDKQEKQKIPTILTGIILLYYYKIFTKELSDDALILLSHNIAYNFSELDEIKELLSFTTPNILETICKKTNDYSKRDDYFGLAETFFIRCDKSTLEEKENYVTDRIKNMTEDEFLNLNKNNCDFSEVENIAKNMGIKI